MSKIWITSDLHFGHGNIIKYCPESRGHYTSVDEMNESIITNINASVAEEDMLIITGDIGFTSPQKNCDFLTRLNGQKVIVFGNHDKKLRNSTEFRSQWARMRVVSAQDYLEMDYTHNNEKYFFCLMHYPLYEWNRKHHKAVMLHGHSHSPNSRRDTFGPEVRCMDVGLDGNFMYPYSLDSICELMRTRGSSYNGHHVGTE